MRFRLQRVHFMPKQLEPGVLYVSEEFGAVAHLCACGCGSKVNTPLAPTEWSLEETEDGPSLSPSIGNWQQACQTHYWITRGQVLWSKKWSRQEIEIGRRQANQRRQAYYAAMHPKGGLLGRLSRWIMGLFSTRTK